MEIKKSREIRCADRIMVYGVEGVGKTTFAASAKKCLVLDVEGGLQGVDVDYVSIKNWIDFLTAIRSVPAEYETVVIDSIDKLETILAQHICDARSWDSIESPGFGRGYAEVAEKMRGAIYNDLQSITDRGVDVILIAHAAIKNFLNPLGADYSRYEPKLTKKTCESVMEWCDVILFCEFAANVDVRDGRGTGKARQKLVDGSTRIMHTTHSPAYTAKNRMSLPPVLPLSYAAFDDARRANRRQSNTTTVDADDELQSLTTLARRCVAVTSLDEIRATVQKICGGKLSDALPEHRVELRRVFENILSAQKKLQNDGESMTSILADVIARGA